MRLSRLMVLFITTLALVFALFFPNELVNLLIFGYDGVSQFFPGVVLGLFWKRVSKWGVFSGLIVGLGTVVGLIVTQNDPFLGLNAGFVGLALNVIVTYFVSLKTHPVKAEGW
jgi:SSS family solute:Na+ symporter